MDFLKKFDYRSLTNAQWVGIVVAGLIVLYIVLTIANSFLTGVSFPGVPGVSQVAPTMGYATGGGFGGKASFDNANSVSEELMPELSSRNAASVYPAPSSPVGDTAEDFEVTQYNANIETRRLRDTCGSFEELKKRTDVVFENANSSENSCSYTFKVKHASVEEVLAWLKKLNPRELNESTYTIKTQIDDFTKETEVLENKRNSIDATLKSAMSAYDEITRLATNTQNADALAKIIDSKIQMIERLTQEKININVQLDRLVRGKAEQLDRLDYTYFYVNVYENKFVDTKQLGDSWKQAVREFVQKLNQMLQDLTIGLVLFLLFIIQWLIYAVIVLMVAKYGWRFVRAFWNK